MRYLIITALSLSLFFTSSVTALISRGLSSSSWTRGKCGPEDTPTQWADQVNGATQPLPLYPRPQFVRDDKSWQNLNGLWEWQIESNPMTEPNFNTPLTSSILVPFPPESCLSGQGAFNNWPTPPPSFLYTLYRLVFDTTSDISGAARSTLNFGAVDWNASVWLNEKYVGSHIGGYSMFSLDVTAALKATNNELFVFAHDPSDSGPQPAGKQRVSTIVKPGGDHYTPSSGVWQTVWLEATPSDYISRIDYETTTSSVTVNVAASTSSSRAVTYNVSFQGVPVVNGGGMSGSPFLITIPSPHTWSPNSPELYDITVTLAGSTDSVTSYFGLRTISKGNIETPYPATSNPGVDRPDGDLPGSPFTLPSADASLCAAACTKDSACLVWAYAIPNCDGYKVPTCWLKGPNAGAPVQKTCRISGEPGGTANITRPLLNGNFTFYAGWLDQSWWPDGIYVAPTDEALAYDVASVKTFGLNAIRLHQKENPQRWYYWADKLGVIVQQDAIQKFEAGFNDTADLFKADLKAMVDDLRSHPSIFAWTIFNEGDCVNDNGMDPAALVAWLSAYDGTRLIDTNSGGPANSLYIGDLNDLHSYPYPSKVFAGPAQGLVRSFGEFGGIGAYVASKEWVTSKCHTYLPAPLPSDEAAIYVNMTKTLSQIKYTEGVSISIYTQITDVELECDGFLNYDRTNKFDAATLATIVAANVALINS